MSDRTNVARAQVEEAGPIRQILGPPQGLIIGLYLNIVGGLLVAALLLVTGTLPKVVVALVFFAVLGVILPLIFLIRRNRSLAKDLAAAHAQLAEDTQTHKTALSIVGIEEIAQTMGDSRWSPDAVMLRAHHDVRFLGVFGHKWTLDSNRREEFRRMLTRVQLNGGHVQFLLLDPNSAAARKLAAIRNLTPEAYKDFDSISFFRSLQVEFDAFELRLYEHFPFLRLLFVDGLCAVSRFRVHAGPEETLLAPQLVFAPEEPGRTWTMYQAHKFLYEHLWAQAADPDVSRIPSPFSSSKGGEPV